MSEDINNVNQSPEDKAISDFMTQRERDFKPYWKAAQLSIKANIAYLCGHQNIFVLGGQIHPLPSPYETQVVSNRILPAVVNDIAVATKTNPTIDVVPAGTDEDDKATALMGQRFMPYLQRINGKDLGRSGVVLWYDLAGIAWRKVFWDGKHSVAGTNPMQDQPGHQTGMEEGALLWNGEAIVETVGNNEIIFDHRNKNYKRQKWIIHAKRITLGEVVSRFGVEAAQKVYAVNNESVANMDNDFELGILRDFAKLAEDIAPTVIPEKTDGVDRNKMIPYDNIVEYRELWHERDDMFPEGVYAVKVNGLVVTNQPYPIEQYPHGLVPFIASAPLSLKGITPQGISRISQARPLQREYNELRSCMKDHADAMYNSIFMASRDSNLAWSQIDNTNANVVEYDGIMKPTRASGVPLPNGIFSHLAEVKMGIDEIFAFHGPSRGQAPPGIESGRGLQLLQEADFTQMGPMVKDLDEDDERVVHQLLSLSIQNYGERSIPIMGKDNSWAIEKVNTAELNGKYNVIVRAGSSLPLTRAIESQKASEAWQSGILGNPNDPQVRAYVMRQMDFGNIEALLKKDAKQIDFAQKEFINAEKIAMEMPPIPPGLDEAGVQMMLEQFVFMSHPNAFDNNHIHIMVHGDYMMDKFWELQSSGNPALQLLVQAMVVHVEEHKQIIQHNALMAAQKETELEAFKRGNTIPQLLIKKSKPVDSKAKTSSKTK